ncbi:Guanylate-kinase-associated protein (GKAP) family protein [Acanthocheilonema viteae]
MGKYTTEPKMRPSAIGHFFSRIGSMRQRSKSPRDPSMCMSDDTVTSCPTQPTSPISSVKNGTNVKDNELNAENELHISPPPKPKRHSSPFFRIIHRLSMNRETREASSVDRDAHDCSQSARNELTSSHETVFSTSNLLTTYNSGDVLPRPTVSENDLRLLTLQKNQEMERSVTALSMNTSGIHPDDNFDVITRVPSYLRISCALNGYRRPYRHIDESHRRQNVIRPKLPMSIVETRKLAFSQNDGQNNDNQKSVTSEEITSRNNSQMGDDISRTSAAVRQLVEHFDHLLENNSNGEMKNMGGAEDSIHNENMTISDETHTAKPLDPAVTPKNSLAFSDHLYDSAYWHSSPKPSVAQRMHQALMKTSMESEPHIGNQSEINVENGQSVKEQIAETVKNENGVNFVLPDGEAYRSLLMEARTNLQLLCDQAKNDLLSEEDIPEQAAGTLRTAIGKANLLLDKKMAKFEDLVKNHLDQNSDVQQVKLSDLSGYWALISIELKELETNFREISFLRENHWTLPESELCSVSTVDENRGDVMKKVQSHIPVINNEKVAFEIQRRQIALAAAKRRQKELKKAEEEQHSERKVDGEVHMVI